MFLIIKNIITDNIELQYNNKYNFYKLIYNSNYVKLIGISLKINIYKTEEIYKNNYKIYINCTNTIKNLLKIEKKFKTYIPNFNLIETDISNNYIVCKNINNIDLLNKNINIIIYKVKYNNFNNSYKPIINIV